MSYIVRYEPSGHQLAKNGDPSPGQPEAQSPSKSPPVLPDPRARAELRRAATIVRDTLESQQTFGESFWQRAIAASHPSANSARQREALVASIEHYRASCEALAHAEGFDLAEFAAQLSSGLRCLADAARADLSDPKVVAQLAARVEEKIRSCGRHDAYVTARPRHRGVELQVEVPTPPEYYRGDGTRHDFDPLQHATWLAGFLATDLANGFGVERVYAAIDPALHPIAPEKRRPGKQEARSEPALRFRLIILDAPPTRSKSDEGKNGGVPATGARVAGANERTTALAQSGAIGRSSPGALARLVERELEALRSSLQPKEDVKDWIEFSVLETKEEGVVRVQLFADDMLGGGMRPLDESELLRLKPLMERLDRHALRSVRAGTSHRLKSTILELRFFEADGDRRLVGAGSNPEIASGVKPLLLRQEVASDQGHKRLLDAWSWYGSALEAHVDVGSGEARPPEHSYGFYFVTPVRKAMDALSDAAIPGPSKARVAHPLIRHLETLLDTKGKVRDVEVDGGDMRVFVEVDVRRGIPEELRPPRLRRWIAELERVLQDPDEALLGDRLTEWLRTCKVRRAPDQMPTIEVEGYGPSLILTWRNLFPHSHPRSARTT